MHLLGREVEVLAGRQLIGRVCSVCRLAVAWERLRDRLDPGLVYVLDALFMAEKLSASVRGSQHCSIYV